MRSALAFLVVIALASCMTPEPASSSSPAGSNPSPWRPVRPDCRLPVMLWSNNGLESHGGFIDTSTGAFTADPKSLTVLDVASGLQRTPDQPYLYGRASDQVAFAQGSYDLPRHRWLPVPREFTSPDESEYAYNDIQPGPLQGVHLVDVKTGADHVIPGTEGDPDARGYHYWVIAFEANGIYVTGAGQLGGGGLFLLDPADGTVRQVSNDAPAAAVTVAGLSAWWTFDPADATEAADPHVYYEPLTGLAGQHPEAWFERTGFRVHVLGTSSYPQAVVMAQSQDTAELWLLQPPNHSVQISTGETTTGGQVVAYKTAVMDSHGWWIGSDSGVFYEQGGELLPISRTAAVVVGGCLQVT